MVFVAYDDKGLVRCITQNWVMVRSALDFLVSLNTDKPPKLEIYADSDFSIGR